MKLAVVGGTFCCGKRRVGLCTDVDFYFTLFCVLLYTCTNFNNRLLAFPFIPVVDELRVNAVAGGIENLRRL